jgi:hypothetical protein
MFNNQSESKVPKIDHKSKMHEYIKKKKEGLEKLKNLKF